MSDESALSKIVVRALEANVRYASMVGQLATTALESLLSTAVEIGPKLTAVTQSSSPTRDQAKQVEVAVPPPGPAAIVLEGKAGDSAVGFFVVENHLAHEITTIVEVSSLTAPDGRQLKSVLRFEPGNITLAAGEHVVAKVTAPITKRLVAGARYQGEIAVPGVHGARIPIIIRRSVDAAATGPRGSEKKKAVAKKKPVLAKKKKLARVRQRTTTK
jgi:hypothetical protein